MSFRNLREPSGTPAYALTEWGWHKTANGAHPSGAEQQQLWLMNRARQNPRAEGEWLAASTEHDVANGRTWWKVSKAQLRQAFAELAPRPPAAHDVRLYQAAHAHSVDQIARDVQDHQNQLARADAQGFDWTQFRGNVYSYAENSLMAHAGFNIDWGLGTHGMQTPPGHRLAIMSVDGSYTNVGIASIAESNPSTTVGPVVVTQNFARADETTANHFNRFIVGTVWKDLNNNARYDPGEGFGGVTVTPSSGSFYAVTAAGGGYAIPVTTPGPVSVSFSGGAVMPRTLVADVGNSSVLLDYQTNAPAGAGEDFVPGPIISLQANGVDTGRYGNGYGTNQHKRSLTATFTNPGHDLMLFVKGFDIDRSAEVIVYLNGRRVGTLGRGSSSRYNAGDRFFFPNSWMQAQNFVEFRQRYDGEAWGVYRLTLRNSQAASIDSALVGAANPNAYGFRFGSNANPVSYRTSFTNTGKDLLLRAWGYDIDSSREVEVVLNSQRIGWMKPGPNNGLQKTSVFSIPSMRQLSGENIVEFRARGDAWGVQNVRLLDVSGPVVNLAVGAAEPGRYGWGYGSRNHRTVVRTQFIGGTQDLLLLAAGFDVTSVNKVGVYLNGRRISSLERGARAKEARVTRVMLPRSLQTAGTNTLEFRNDSRPGTRWGVGNISLIDASGPDLTLTMSVRDPGIYGWQLDTSTHRGLLRAEFVSDGADLEFSASGSDIGSDRELSVWLNGRLVGFMPSSSRATRAEGRFVLPIGWQEPGVNSIEIRSNKPGSRWSVSDLLLRDVSSSGVPLIPGVTDYSTYGWSYLDGDQRAIARMEFDGSYRGLELAATGFDIQTLGEVGIFLNGRRIGFVRPGGSGVHSAPTRIFIPAGLQLPDANVIEFIKMHPGGRWGVTAVGLTPQ